MKNVDVANLIELSTLVTKYFNEVGVKNNIRKRKTSINDGIAFKMLHGNKNTSQDMATWRLNNFMNRKTKATLIDRRSYIDREKSIDLGVYEGLYNRSIDKPLLSFLVHPIRIT